MNQQSEKIIKEIFINAGIEISVVTPEIKQIFKSINYIDLIKPSILKERDKQEGRLKIGQLAVKYGVDRSQIKYILYGIKKQEYY